MIFANIVLGKEVEIDPSSSVNNATLGDHVKIAKRCSVFGSSRNQLQVGHHSYVGMNTLIEGYGESVTIGAHVSIAPNVHIMSSSGPNASQNLQRVFPITSGPVNVGDHCWIGAGAVIMPGVTLGKCCIVAVNSFVNKSFPDFTVIGGAPAKVIRELTAVEREKILAE